MKSVFLATSMLAAGLFLAAPAHADTLAYPGPDNASFIIDHPSEWAVEPGENVGDYVTLAAPTGAVLQLRTVPASDDAMEQAIAENVEYLQQTFTEVELGEPQEIEEGGLSGSLILGNGTDKEDQDVGFAMYFIALPDGTIADIWYAVVKGDSEGGDAAVKILNSFRTP
jgi:hypothetical protein